MSALLFLSFLAHAAPEVEVGAYTGAVIVGAEHELYDSAGGAAWRRLGPGIPLGLRGGFYPVGAFGLEGELHGGPAPIVDAGLGLLYAGRLQAVARTGRIGDMGLRLHLAAGGGAWGVSSAADALGADVDRAFLAGPGARIALAETLSMRADLRYLLVAKKGTGGSELGGTTEVLVGLVLHPRPPAVDPSTLDDDRDGIPNGLDACPTEPETPNGYLDDDGCPDALSQVAIAVVDAKRAPVADAIVLVGGEEAGRTDATGALVLPRIPGSRLEIIATHPVGGRGKAKLVVPEGDSKLDVVLAPVAGTLQVTVHDESGAPIDATLDARGAVDVPDVALGDDGTGEVGLPVGEWDVFIAAEGFGTQRRRVTVEADARTDLGVIVLSPARAVVTATVVEVTEKILFETDGHAIDEESSGILDAIATLLLEHPELHKVEVGGHTDDRGADTYNLELSQRRVEAVVAALVARGVAEGRLVARGYGESKPIGDNTTEAGREANRRVEFQIVERQ